MDYFAVSYYSFRPLADPLKLVATYQHFLESIGAKGRIYLSEEGINAQLSIEKRQQQVFCDWVHQLFPKNIPTIKWQAAKEHAFFKLTVKYRTQLCAFDVPVAIENCGERLSAQQWQQILENRPANTYILDVRNQYESAVGHFEWAITPNVANFRDFPRYTEK